MENLLATQQEIEQLQFKQSCSSLKLRLHVLETLIHLSRLHNQAQNPVLRHHVHVTFHHIQEIYQTISDTPVSFKWAKREVLSILHSFAEKVRWFNTQQEAMPAMQQEATGAPYQQLAVA